jgi:hypothetical protein
MSPKPQGGRETTSMISLEKRPRCKPTQPNHRAGPKLSLVKTPRAQHPRLLALVHILNNELYNGERVWNRQRYIKDPNTGKRQARLNPETEWVRNEVPDLRLIEADMWQRVKRRQGVIRSTLSEAQRTNASNPLARAKRTKHLFSGLLKCGCCGGSYTIAKLASLYIRSSQNWIRMWHSVWRELRLRMSENNHREKCVAIGRVLFPT